MDRFKIIATAAFCMTLAWSMHQATFNNFVGEELKIAASQLGVLHSIREIPGLLTVLLSALLVYVSESKIATLSLFVCGIGFVGIALSNNFYQLLLPMVIMSTGLHFFFPLRSSMTIDVSAAKSKAESLGKIGSIQALAALCAFGVVFLVVDAVEFRGVFLLAGIAAIAGGAVLVPMNVTGKPFKRRHIIIKKKYTNFYILQFFSGCRRHIFTTFAIFSLVVIHGLSVKYVTLLLTITNSINLYTRAKIGRVIDQFGEKSTLTMTYVVLIFIFLGYGYLQNIYVLAGLYCLDHVLFGSNVALPSYMSAIAEKGDVAPSLAFGSTINHIAAIFIPVLGGLVWDAYGYRATFVLGAGLLLFSIFFAQRIEV